MATSHRDGESSADRTVSINTGGVPARPTTEISSYINVSRSILLNHNTLPHVFTPKQLQDPNGHIIARLQTVTPTKYNGSGLLSITDLRSVSFR